MTKFKIGDKVRVKSIPTGTFEPKGEYFFSDSMVNYIGVVGIVTNVNSNGSVCIDRCKFEGVPFIFHENWIELVESKRGYSFFDLEQEIMNCWSLKEDLEVIYHESEGATEDELMNALLGLIQLTDWKFQRLFKTFEKAMEDR